ncbi:hypothetical protein GTQ43_11815 [Nostoc sp. KVJ3]|uniref:hypothetical protein n=1 Tax=Nostoc sp. KVJ3 TaxID=457945 RepID=UPI002237542A|nr:hypothetical protein [Nostoc sp. KVJ3]MCW5314469.1 hypothetical protein [Nostoc sp. KVJ3]
MNKIIITLLSGSSFLALTLLTVNPAFAKKLSPEDLANPTLTPTDTQAIAAPVSQEYPQYPSVRANEKIKQLAMQLFGCACPSCQAKASQMILQGSLPLPQ